MNFSELVSEVTDITRRPDLQTRIESAVRASVLKAHQKEYYYRDIKEQGLSFDIPAVVQTLSPRELFPLYRAPAYIRRWFGDANSGYARGEFTKKTIGNLVDIYGQDLKEVYYQAGVDLKLRGRYPIQYILFGYFANPNVTTDGWSSWIADEYPYGVAYDAASFIMNATGNQTQGQALAQQAATFYTELSISNQVADFIL